MAPHKTRLDQLESKGDKLLSLMEKNRRGQGHQDQDEKDKDKVVRFLEEVQDR